MRLAGFTVLTPMKRRYPTIQTSAIAGVMLRKGYS
jgi:hypothetical protein